MDCRINAIEERLKKTPLGLAISRIVRIIIAMTKHELCGNGLAASAVFSILATKSPEPGLPSTDIAALGGEIFATKVISMLCEANPGSWNRQPAAYNVVAQAQPLEFTPLYGAPCSNDTRLETLVTALQSIFSMISGLMGCSSAERKAAKVRDIRDYITQAIGDRISLSGTCASHANELISREFRVDVFSRHEAIVYIGNEIAKAVCEGSTRDLTGEDFAAYVANMLVDGACKL